MSEERIYPTIGAYAETHDLDGLQEAVGRIPVNGSIGRGKVERLFCRLARQVVKRQGIVCWVEALENCPHYCSTYCGMTGYEHDCLFLHPGDPQWETIRRSVTLEC